MNLQAVFLVVGFVAVLLAVIVFIAFVERKVGGNVSQRVFDPVERIIIASVLLGAAGMFQPWALAGYRVGFHLLLFSTLAFTVWSHVVPESAHSSE